MNKSNIAVIGMGGAGNKMLDALLDINRVYTPVYMNTSILEMENMKYISPERNMLYVVNGEGTGKNKEFAKELLKESYPKIVDWFGNKFSSISGIDTFFLLCGASGGSGGTMVSMMPRVIKKINENAIINVVIAMPDLDEKEDSLRNALIVWKDIKLLQDEGFVNSVQFIDNNKMGENQEEFNAMVMKDLDDSLSINYKEIDINDSKKVNCAKGYKVVLNLNRNKSSMKSAIDEAIKNNNYLLPNNMDCNILMASFDEDYYNKNDAKRIFNVFGDEKYDYNADEKNIIVMGGLEQPVDYIELLEDALNTLQTKRVEREERLKSLDDKFDFFEEIKPKQQEKPKKAKRLTKKDLAKIMEDDDLW